MAIAVLQLFPALPEMFPVFVVAAHSMPVARSEPALAEQVVSLLARGFAWLVWWAKVGLVLPRVFAAEAKVCSVVAQAVPAWAAPVGRAVAVVVARGEWLLSLAGFRQEFLPLCAGLPEAAVRGW